MMKETEALVSRVKKVNETHQHLHLTVDESLLQIKAGQSVLVRPQTATLNPYLREQWFPVGITKTALIMELPLHYNVEPGRDVFSLMGLIGQPFKFRKTLRSVLLIAVDTAPTPLTMVIAPLLSNNVAVSLILLGEATHYGTSHLPPEVEVLTGGEDLNWTNRVTSIGWADQVFVCVPPGAEMPYFERIWTLFSELRSHIDPNYLFGIFRPPLPCGTGACQACMLKKRGNKTLLLCEAGPAIDLSEVRFT